MSRMSSTRHPSPTPSPTATTPCSAPTSSRSTRASSGSARRSGSDVSPPLGDEPWADVWLAPEQASAQFFGMIHLYPGRAWRRTALFSFDPFEKGRSFDKTPEYPSSLFHSGEKTGPPPGLPARTAANLPNRRKEAMMRDEIGRAND